MVDLLVTYMEMLRPPAGEARAAPTDGVTIGTERLSVDAYLALYRAVGDPVQWDGHLVIPREELAALLADPAVDLFVLRRDGNALGFCQFDRRHWPEAELLHFGLVPSAQGRGLGPYLLDAALRALWARHPTRVWLHTDTEDDPLAQAVYERAGFRIYKQQVETFSDS